MKETLERFTQESLFDATSALLSKLNIYLDRETAQPIDVAELYEPPVPKYFIDALQHIQNTYFIGIVNDLSLQGNKSGDSLESTLDQMKNRGDKYDGMFVFACDAKLDANLSRTAATALTRAFNRIACANPVILVIRQGCQLSLATCERMEYSQQWRQGTGERVGKVNILRNINCDHPHRGHLDILTALGERQFTTFNDLYNHWLNTFSNELLTKKFYTELSDWFAWAVKVCRFPNDLSTRDDDDKFNHEACIRLITRLIFVWFLKEKKLIPEEFFDQDYIRENLISDFSPTGRKTAHYDPEQSKYYRLILQNLFFAMLNRPIVAEGKATPNNRRFMEESFQGKNPDHNINNIMRYKKDFAEGGAEKFIKLANSNVPFLNGGLFECLDNKSRKMFYDGFSEEQISLEQLYLPDFLFFGNEDGRKVDLSKWYGDRRKKNATVRGLIDILKRYSFTIEENTPLDQEVSLDPELLGKVFENLLAAYNPETKTSARKQTGSFYTPREIVQYMVDESLVAHLKRTCGNDLEPEYRRLLSYATDETSLSDEQRKAIMQALYNCRVLDPACGSGAFPMGILQQMVHVLRQLDPTNEMWKDFMIDRAIEQSKVAYGVDSDEERKARLDDIENAFNRSINDPDYARKLYLIEHCIYGVDIQPIATQISKLRFFISLVVDQKPNTDAKANFGIRPLPNLESKFVTANTLIPVKYDGTLVENNDDVRKHKEKLRELNHKIFLAKRNVDKQRLKDEIKATRQALAQAIEDTGFVTAGAAQQLASWDMFDQNASSVFFDPEWMFGVKDGFDVVIANPPYVEAKKLKYIASTLKGIYKVYSGTADFSIYFIELGLSLLREGGELTYITTNKFFTTGYGKNLRQLLINHDIHRIIDFEQVEVFENVLVSSTVIGIGKQAPAAGNLLTYAKFYQLNRDDFKKKFVERKNNLGTYPQDVLNDKEWSFADTMGLQLKAKIEKDAVRLKDINGVNVYRGVTTGYNPAFIINSEQRDELIALDSKNACVIKNMLQGRNIRKWYYNESDDYLLQTGYDIDIEHDYPYIFRHLLEFENELETRADQGKKWYNLRACKYYGEFEKNEKIIWGLTADRWAYALDTEGHYLPSNGYMLTSTALPTKYILGILNSNLLKYYFKFIGVMTAGGAYTLKASTIEALPLVIADRFIKPIVTIVDSILSLRTQNHDNDIAVEEQILNKLVYHLYALRYEEVLVIDPNTTITRAEYDNFKLPE